MLGRRQTTDGEDALDSGSRVIRRIDLRRAHMQLTQPNRRMVGIERHEAIVQDADRKAKAAGERALWAIGWGNESRKREMRNRVVEECRKPALAHVRRNDDGSFAIHELEEHLRAVGGQNQDSFE